MSDLDQIPDPESLLMEPSPLSLNDLFEKDPILLTREDESRIISEMRKARVRWANEDRAAKTQGRKAKTSAGIKETREQGLKKVAEAEALATDLGIDLDSLVGDL